MISLKAVILGVLTVAIVGLVFSAAAPPFEMLFARWLVEDGDSLGTILDKMYWPANTFIWSGILAAFGLGSYVATRFSQPENALDSTVVLIGILVIVWAIQLYSAAQNLLGITLYSIVAVIATIAGTMLARRRHAALDT